MAKVCPKCGHVDNEGSAFCENCGQPLSTERTVVAEDKNLQQMLEEQPLQRIELFKCIEWFDESLELLITLHSQNPPLIHGDIRPQYIKLNKNGRLYFSGFVGNIDELERKPDMATDIFCLGATFHFLFSGQLPHQPGSRELFLPLSKPLNTYVPDFPYEIQEILDRMLHPNRDLRYKTCQEVRDDLAQYLNKYQNKQKLSGGSLKISFGEVTGDGKLSRISPVSPIGAAPPTDPGPQAPFSTYSPTEKLKPIAHSMESPEPETAEVKEIMGIPRGVKIGAAVIILLLFLFVVLPQILPRLKFKSLMNAGNRSLEQQQYDKALENYKEALKIFPGRQKEVISRICMIHWNQAVDYMSRGLAGEARTHIIHIKKLTSGEPQLKEHFSGLLLKMGREHLDREEYYKAFLMAQDARMINTNSSQTVEFHKKIKGIILERGVSRYNKEEYQGAIEDFDVLIEDPHQEGYLKLYYWRGSALVKLNRFLDGLDDLYKAKILSAEGKIDLNEKEEKALEKFIDYSGSQLKSIHLAKAASDLVDKGLKAYDELRYQDCVNYLGKVMRLIERNPRVKDKMDQKYRESFDKVRESLADSYLRLASEKIQEKELSEETVENVREMCQLARKYSPSENVESRCKEIIAKISKSEKTEDLSLEALKLLDMGQNHYSKGEFDKSINPLERFLAMVETHPEREAIKGKMEESVLNKIPEVRRRLADAYYRRALSVSSKAGLDREVQKRFNEDCRMSEKYDPSEQNVRRCRELKKSIVIPSVNP